MPTVTGGNQFLVCQLVASLRADQVAPTAEAAAAVAGMVPDSVLRSVLLRLAQLPPAAGALAEAAAVLGPASRFSEGTVITFRFLHSSLRIAGEQEKRSSAVDLGR